MRGSQPTMGGSEDRAGGPQPKQYEWLLEAGNISQLIAGQEPGTSVLYSKQLDLAN